MQPTTWVYRMETSAEVTPEPAMVAIERARATARRLWDEIGRIVRPAAAL